MQMSSSSRQPQQYDSKLAEAGQNLSGGQQQAPGDCPARFVKKAPILVLDEATSSLDAISEEQNS
jgi:ABC-type bacteriocin/lantibiotic exporter with double-glycine peptidase domain